MHRFYPYFDRRGIQTSCSLSLRTTPAKKIVWFRDHALRIHDNQALAAAIKDSRSSSPSILPLYLWTSSADEKKQACTCKSVNFYRGGTARDVFMANALDGLNSTLGGNLALGLIDDTKNVAEELIHVCRKANSKEVYYLKSHDEREEKAVEKILKENGIEPRPFGGAFSLIDYSTHMVPWVDIVLEHPWRSPLIPFVDYVKKVMDAEGPKQETHLTADELKGAIVAVDLNDGDTVVSSPYLLNELLKDVGITPGGTKWGKSIASSWPASESDAMKALSKFLESLEEKGNDASSMKRTHLASRLSPYLARGLLSPHQVYNGIKSVGDDADVDSFVRRICWRDYTYAAVNLYPDVTNGKSIRRGYELLDGGIQMESDERKKRLRSWQTGMTGFPLIDAGMRQLKAEGWMPQKVRLACSTFLVEGLGLPWRDGMLHFADFLVDYDVAINSNMWQNAGCVGLDPYYVGMNYKRRMYWDKNGQYVRKWCPELSELPDAVDIHLDETTRTVDCLYEPWATPPEVLERSGVTLGDSYPHRVCDDRDSRAVFFSEVREMRSKWPPGLIDDRKRDLVSLGSTDIGLFTPRALQIRQPRYSK